MQWELVGDGKVLKTGIVNELNVAPQQKNSIRLDLGLTDKINAKEVFINVAYKLKSEEQGLDAGATLARQQLVVKEYQFEALQIANNKYVNQKLTSPELVENDVNYLLVLGESFQMDFNRHSGFLSRYIVDGKEVLKEGATLKPNFWRAPTDNDFGARLQYKYAVWKNPKMDLKSLDGKLNKDGLAEITAMYDMPEVSAQLVLNYLINNDGELMVKQQLLADDNASVSDMFRFGMKLEMPGSYDFISYYGRGPGENYVDRKDSEFVGLYQQQVHEQAYSYIRPQETGTKSDIRWWKQVDVSGFGICVNSNSTFSMSALNYTIDDLDDGKEKDQRHMPQVVKSDFVTICIDQKQMGLGCITSWGALPRPEYRIPYQDYEFEFVIKPVDHEFKIY